MSDDAQYRWGKATMPGLSRVAHVLTFDDGDGSGTMIVGEVWRNCSGRWNARIACGCTFGPAESLEDAKGWLWDRREHGH